jgi:hypothetical protein
MCEIKEWTLMFYFASDNPLAISAVSQLKAIKDAGFHPDANVVVQFDPFTEGTPTHVFDVNLVNKLKSPRRANVGFAGDDPIVRSMIEDKLWRDEKTSPEENNGVVVSNGEPVRNALNRAFRTKYNIEYKPPVAPNVNNVVNARNGNRVEEPDPQTSLREFLRFCADKYPAKHYMLFMLGHGVVVGNDVFMLDEHATEHSLTLTDLGRILGEFKHSIELEDETLDLVSFHSCSVSSMEVAYELQGIAKYMLASQGPAYVGSWPYRQILIHLFNALSGGGRINVRNLLSDIHHSCMLNSADYLLAGYSFQLTLCDLVKLGSITGAIEELSKALIAGLEKKNDLSRDCILLSHWKSQSFFNEMYTDLYDFCFCFSKKIEELVDAGVRPSPELLAIHRAAGKVMDKLVKENPKKPGFPDLQQIIVAADSLGPAFQYSRGLSVYFPWSEPSADSPILAEYAKYRFSTEFKTPWLQFLKVYFDKTRREVSGEEADMRRYIPSLPGNPTLSIVDTSLDEDIASLVYNGEGMPDQSAALARGDKTDPTDKTGGDLESISIKNFPRDTRARRDRMQQADRRFPVSETFGLLEKNGRNGNH